ncbi:MAG: recombinase family protein [Pseudonocardiaceae bacterium]
MRIGCSTWYPAVTIEFVTEQLSCTGEDSPMANLLLSVMGAFAKRALIHERQREGIAAAKQRGVYRGHKKSSCPGPLTAAGGGVRGRGLSAG